MVKLIPWALGAFCAAHIISLIAIYLYAGRIEVDDVHW